MHILILKRDLFPGLLAIFMGVLMIVFSEKYTKMIQDWYYTIGLKDQADEGVIKLVGIGGIIIGLIIIFGLYRYFG